MRCTEQGPYLSYVVHANRTEEIPAAGLLFAALLLGSCENHVPTHEMSSNSYLLFFGENRGDRSAGSSPLMMLLMGREATAAENFGEKCFVVADMRQGRQVLVGMISNWDHSHGGNLVVIEASEKRM
jgi:hypothetical protein